MLPTLTDFLEERALDGVVEQLVLERGSVPFGPPTRLDILQAIEERKYVGIYYADEDSGVLAGFRLIEPLVYGTGYVDHHTGEVLYPQREYLRAYVVRDSKSDMLTRSKVGVINRKSVSKSERTPYFRLLRIDRIQEWSLIPRTIHKYRELYNPEDRGIAVIKAQIELTDFPGGRYSG